VSVRDAILGVLTLGPTYGHQILFELETRLPHRASINPGQVYSTIARLATSGQIRPAGMAPDNLPRYELTTSGRHAVQKWLSGEEVSVVRSWDDVMDVVLLSCSLPGSDPSRLFERLRGNDTANATTGESSTIGVARNMSRRAEEINQAAVSSWLTEVEGLVKSGDFPTHGFSENRPGRGRRPSAVAHPSD
jgi:DNA-binding PadR family transcriptional regulator